MPTIDYQKLSVFLFEENLSDILKRAENGDIYAAKQALPALASLISTNHVHPQTSEILPIPIVARDYLAKAFSQMAAGVDPRVALNLKVNHRPREPYLRKLIVGYLIWQANEQCDSINGAIDVVVDALKEILEQKEKKRRPDIWDVFRGKKHYDAGVLRKYYYDPEVQEALKKGASMASSES